ncbi:hypothetical protein [Nonomuraea sp. NPDC050783]|uniref:hypothetical protein n=1 Tax=Nonomuraea sp. NPDC050783 TaxID=3154634 RepID=UPI0034666026
MKKTVAAGVPALSASLTSLGATPAEAAVPVTALPAPTGGHPVGRADLHLIDSSRPDL